MIKENQERKHFRPFHKHKGSMQKIVFYVGMLIGKLKKNPSEIYKSFRLNPWKNNQLQFAGKNNKNMILELPSLKYKVHAKVAQFVTSSGGNQLPWLFSQKNYV